MTPTRLPRMARAALLSLLLASLAPSTARAQAFDVAPYTGVTAFLSDPPARFALEREDGTTLVVSGGSFARAWTNGIAADVAVNARLAVRIEGALATSSMSADEGPATDGVDVYTYGMTFFFTPNSASRLGPFAGVGVGGRTFDFADGGLKSHTDLTAGATAGLSFRATDRIRLRLEGDDRIGRFDSRLDDGDSSWLNAMALRAVLSWRVAGRR